MINTEFLFLIVQGSGLKIIDYLIKSLNLIFFKVKNNNFTTKTFV